MECLICGKHAEQREAYARAVIDWAELQRRRLLLPCRDQQPLPEFDFSGTFPHIHPRSILTAQAGDAWRRVQRMKPLC